MLVEPVDQISAVIMTQHFSLCLNVFKQMLDENWHKNVWQCCNFGAAVAQSVGVWAGL